MHTISLVSQKGGSGKSTLAIGLAIAAIQDGQNVRILETDPLGTVTNWRRRRAMPEPIVETLNGGGDIEHWLPIFDRLGVTLTIIDTAGGISPMTMAAIRSADLCLIPARPSPIDVEASAPTLRAIRTLDKPFAFILNQTPVRSHRMVTAASSLCDAAIALDVTGVIASPFIALRNDHQDALGAGLAVTEFMPEGRSAEEIRDLWQWIWRRLTSEAFLHQPPAFVSTRQQQVG
ncbi:MAG: nucleotide-binding protein [Xanthobacteraceae bacterium]